MIESCSLDRGLFDIHAPRYAVSPVQDLSQGSKHTNVATASCQRSYGCIARLNNSHRGRTRRHSYREASLWPIFHRRGAAGRRPLLRTESRRPASAMACIGWLRCLIRVMAAACPKCPEDDFVARRTYTAQFESVASL